MGLLWLTFFFKLFKIIKRRYLKPYINPVQLLKKYEKNQFESEIKTKYKFLVKTGPGSYAGTNSAVSIYIYFYRGESE